MQNCGRKLDHERRTTGIFITKGMPGPYRTCKVNRAKEQQHRRCKSSNDESAKKEDHPCPQTSGPQQDLAELRTSSDAVVHTDIERKQTNNTNPDLRNHGNSKEAEKEIGGQQQK